MDNEILEKAQAQVESSSFENVVELINSTKNKVNAVKILEKELKELDSMQKKLNAKKERIEKLTKQLL